MNKGAGGGYKYREGRKPLAHQKNDKPGLISGNKGRTKNIPNNRTCQALWQE